MRAAILLAGVCAAFVACGPAAESPVGEPWPIRTGTPGVLGYVALSAAPEDLGTALERALGWTPGGLSGDMPLSILLLDEVVFGSPLAVALPIDDEAAFRASLERSPLIRHVQGESWVIALQADHPALRFLRVMRSVASPSPTPADVMNALRGQEGVEWDVQLSVGGGRAILSPSFEAAIVAKRVFNETPGFSLTDGPVVMSFDAQRIHLAYQAEIQGAVNKARALLLGVQMAGFASLFSRMAGGADEGLGMSLPLPGPAIWALLEMLSLEEIDGLQLSLRGVDGGALLLGLPAALEPVEGEGAPRVDGGDAVLDVRMVWAEDSAPARMLAAMRPVKEVRGATVLGFDQELFPAALAEWSRPLVELTMGEGKPAERLLQRIEELLAPCDGALIVGSEPDGRALAIPVRPGLELDIDGMGEVLELFAHTLDLDLDGDSEGLVPWDGESSSEGIVPAGRYWQSGDAFFLTLGGCSAYALDELGSHAEEASAAASVTPGAPFLSLDVSDASARMFERRGELLLELPWPNEAGQ